MKWFWKEKGKTSPELEAIWQLKEQNNLLADQYKGLVEQITKLSRLQYKTSKDILGKVDSFVKKQEHHDHEKELRIAQTEAKLEELSYSLIRWLDDLDLVCSGLIENDQEEWKKILKQWSNQIVEQLEGVGIVEIHVLGSSFDPTKAESLGTIPMKDAATKYKEIKVQRDIPYQVVEVLKRGFIGKNGSLFRKAQVITIEKENEHVQ